MRKTIASFLSASLIAASMLLAPASAYAASAGVAGTGITEKMVATKNDIDTETNIYLTSMASATRDWTVSDTTHFYLDGGNVMAKTSGSFSSSNPFSVKFKNAGYTVDGRSVDLLAECTRFSTTKAITDDLMPQLIMSVATNTGQAGLSLQSIPNVGREMTMRFSIYYSGTTTRVPDAKYLLVTQDLDTTDFDRGYTWEGYCESLRLDSGYDRNNVYVATNTILQGQNEDGKPIYRGSGITGHDATHPDNDVPIWYSGVAFIANQNATVTHRIRSGASIMEVESTPVTYPAWAAPKKNPTTQYSSLGQNVSFQIEQTFPYIAASNQPKSISLSDTLDSIFDPSTITVKVEKKNSSGNWTDVTSSQGWNTSVNGQTVTTTTTNCAHGRTEGDFRFTITAKLKNIVTNLSSKEREGRYYKLPNKATVTVTPKTGNATSKTTNEVKVLVSNAFLEIQKMFPL